ncbi:hypothetical protein [Bacillus thuringiensis]|nr:hypothetical protein [Bacillus thuringiensis]
MDEKEKFVEVVEEVGEIDCDRGVCGLVVVESDKELMVVGKG